MATPNEPKFTRGDVAKILGVTPMTIANREKSGRYPDPMRDLNNYRRYSLSDVFNLQLITYSAIDPFPVYSVLYEKGYKDASQAVKLVDDALSRRRGVPTSTRSKGNP